MDNNVEVLEGNLAIAKFVADRLDQSNLGTWMVDFSGNRIWHNVDQKYWLFHSSWDWLIDAIIKFRQLDLNNHIYKSHIQAIDDAVTDGYDINQVYPTVVQAIKWYNTQSK